MNERLEFNEERHEYRLDGVIIPSVTQILKAVGLSPGGDFTSDAVKRALNVGNKVHYALEVYNQLGFEPTEASIKGYFRAYLNWAMEYKVEVLECENIMFYEGLVSYAGTSDLVCMIDGKKCIVDFKTGKNLYDYYSYQLSAYRNLYGEDVDLYILQLKANGEFVFIKFNFFIPNALNMWNDILLAYSNGVKFDKCEITDELEDKWLEAKINFDKSSKKLKSIQNKIAKSLTYPKAESLTYKYKYKHPPMTEKFDVTSFLYEFNDDDKYTKDEIINAIYGKTKIHIGVRGQHEFSLKKG